MERFTANTTKGVKVGGEWNFDEAQENVGGEWNFDIGGQPDAQTGSSSNG